MREREREDVISGSITSELMRFEGAISGPTDVSTAFFSLACFHFFCFLGLLKPPESHSAQMGMKLSAVLVKLGSVSVLGSSKHHKLLPGFGRAVPGKMAQMFQVFTGGKDGRGEEIMLHLVKQVLKKNNNNQKTSKQCN